MWLVQATTKDSQAAVQALESCAHCQGLTGSGSKHGVCVGAGKVVVLMVPCEPKNKKRNKELSNLLNVFH